MDTILQDTRLKAEQILKMWKWMAFSAGCNVFYKTKSFHPLTLLNFLFGISAATGCYGQLIFLWNHRHEPFDVYIEAILIFFQIFISIIKLLMFTFKQHEIFDAVQYVQNADIFIDLEIFELNLINSSEILKDINEILNKSWSTIKFQFRFFTCCVVAIIIGYMGQNLAANINNFKNKSQHFHLEYVFPASFTPNVSDPIKSPLFQILEYFIVLSEVHCTGFCAIAFTGLFTLISNHCLASLKVLRVLISYSTTYHVFREDRIKYMQVCIKFQQKIYEFCSKLNSLYRMPTLSMFLVSCLVICLLTFHANTMGNDVSAIIKVVLYIFGAYYEVGIFCFIGQLIASESEMLPVVIYECRWYKESAQFKDLVKFMIQRSNLPILLNVGGFATLSFVTFIMICRSSISYYLFLLECM
ncbi:odorant receptor 63a-like [Musca autumnalis]|uniref:odorant receptor 63a-like n=1 Tax=Musca autumnalis TaxID=221902 RepID=UPI003CFBBA75